VHVPADPGQQKQILHRSWGGSFFRRSRPYIARCLPPCRPRRLARQRRPCLHTYSLRFRHTACWGSAPALRQGPPSRQLL